jgi:hypothetical protein
MRESLYPRIFRCPTIPSPEGSHTTRRGAELVRGSGLEDRASISRNVYARLMDSPGPRRPPLTRLADGTIRPDAHVGRREGHDGIASVPVTPGIPEHPCGTARPVGHMASRRGTASSRIARSSANRNTY